MDTTQQPQIGADIDADSVPGSAEPLSPQETVERLRELAAWGVDLSLIQASLERTPTERLLRMQELADFIEMMQRAYRSQHEQPASAR